MTTFFWLVNEGDDIRAITFEGWKAGRAYVKNEDGTNIWYEVFLTTDSEIIIKEDDAEGTTFYKYENETAAADAGWQHILESERVRWGLNEICSRRERNEQIKNEWLKQIEEYKKNNS